MLAVYVYSCALRSAVIHIGAGYVIILGTWAYQSLRIENDNDGLRFFVSYCKCYIR